MASAQASRPATIAPAALANRSIRSSGPAGEQPVAQRAAEGVAGAEPVDHLDRHGRHHDRLVRASAPSTPAGPCLTTASSTPASSSASAAAVRVALADGDLALLEVADRDVDVRQRARILPCASSGDVQNIGR